MEKFHLTITDNETGETKCDLDTSAIVTAFDEGTHTRYILMANCSIYDTASVIDCAMDGVKRDLKKDPELRKAVKAVGRVNKVIV